MTNHFYRFIFSFLVVLSSIAGCKKPEKATPVAITFIAPEASSIFQVPDTILVKFNIASHRYIMFVLASTMKTLFRYHRNYLFIPLTACAILRFLSR